MDEEPRHLIILDRAFTGSQGHHRPANELIAKMARAAGYSPQVLASKRAEIAALDEGAPVVPVFEGSPYTASAETDPERLKSLNRSAYEDFARIPEVQLGPRTAVYVHTTTENEVYGLARWLTEAAARTGLVGTLALMMPSGLALPENGPDSEAADLPEMDAPQKAAVYRRALEVLGTARTSILVEGISPSIAREYSVLAGREIGVAPALIPGIGRPLEARDGSADRPPRLLLYAGDIKVDKGFAMLPAIIRRLAASDLAFEAHIQISGMMLARYKSFIEAVKREASGDNRFVLHEGHLSEEDYAKLWSADLCLLAYCPQKYRHQTSGLCWEAMNNAVPAIVVAGTWHERELRHYGFDPVVARAYWPDALYEAVVEGLQRAEKMAADWQALREGFVAQNRPEKFLAGLIELHAASLAQREIAHQDMPARAPLAAPVYEALSF